MKDLNVGEFVKDALKISFLPVLFLVLAAAVVAAALWKGSLVLIISLLTLWAVQSHQAYLCSVSGKHDAAATRAVAAAIYAFGGVLVLVLTGA